MIQWKYKTRRLENSEGGQMERPNGKPAVYFSCHPADLDSYLNTVADEILRFQNCAVWYTDADISFGEIEPFLSAMRLFVLPVTKNLLTSESRTVCEELAYAKENQIPVLPLIMEPGLEQLYRNQFGNAQYISLFSNAAEGNRQLEKYLSVIFSGDEISGKIHEAFGEGCRTEKKYIEILRQKGGMADFDYARKLLAYARLCAFPSTEDPNRSVMTDMQEAQEAFRHVAEIAARPEKDGKNLECRQMLLSSYRYLAKIAEIQDNKEEAFQYAVRHVETAQEAYDTSSDIDYLREMLDGLYACIRFAHSAEEEICYSEKQCKTAEEIAHISGEEDDMERFFTSLSRMAELYKARKNLGKEEEYYLAILELSPKTISRKREYQRYAYLKLADLCSRKNDPYMQGHYMRLWMGEPSERRRFS